MALILDACVCSSSLFPQFSGLWYEIAFATKLQNSPLKARRPGAVLVELKKGSLVLTATYDK